MNPFSHEEVTTYNKGDKTYFRVTTDLLSATTYGLSGFYPLWRKSARTKYQV